MKFFQEIQRKSNESQDNRDAYERDYDSSVSGMDDSNKTNFKRQELQHELGHERNNIAISINGRTWKVIPCKGTADSKEEWSHLNNMKSWAEKKSASTGKKWTVSLTGAPVSETVKPEVQQTVTENEDSPVLGAIIHRIMVGRTDLLAKYGPKLILSAAENVADYVGEVEEIGSSDVSGWVKQVERMLEENPPEAFGEGWQEDSQDLEDWTKEVSKKLYRAHENQRHALARQLSKVEQKHFGSELTNGPLTNIVFSTLQALSKGQMVHYDPQSVGQMPFGSMVGDDARIIAAAGVSSDELVGYRMLSDKGIVDNIKQFLQLRRVVWNKNWPTEYLEKFKGNPGALWLQFVKDLGWSKDDVREAVQAKTDDKLLAYYAQRKAEAEKKKKEQGVKEAAPKRPVAPDPQNYDSDWDYYNDQDEEEMKDDDVDYENMIDEASLAQMRDYFNRPDGNTVAVDTEYGAPERKQRANVPPEIQTLIDKMYRVGKITPQEFDILKRFQAKTGMKVGIKEADMTTGNQGYDSMLAVMKAVDAGQDATFNLGGEPVTLEYPEARFLAGKYKAFLKAGRQEEFLKYMENPMAFDRLMKQLRDLIDKQKNFKGSVPGERGIEEASMNKVSVPAALKMLKKARAYLDQFDPEDDDDYFDAYETIAAEFDMESNDSSIDPLTDLLDMYEVNPQQAAQALADHLQSKGVAEGKLNEDLQADSGEYYEDSADFFGQFEADHFDEEKESNDGMEVRGYIDGVNVMAWRFGGSDKTDGYGAYDDSELGVNEDARTFAPLSKDQYLAQKKALQDIQLDPETANDPELRKELMHRTGALRKQAIASGHIAEGLPKTNEGYYWCSLNKKSKLIPEGYKKIASGYITRK
jgi:hypothetical protein